MSSIGPLAGNTPNYNFNLVNFDWFAWHDYEYENWSLADSLFYVVLGAQNVKGVWTPDTLMNVGERWVDDVDSTMWNCNVQHTSGSTTMADDRTANPTWWTLVAPGDVVGPAVSVDGNVATFNGTSGKIIQDSGLLASNVVVGPASAVDARIAIFNGTSGKVIADGGKFAGDLVSGPASAVNDHIAVFDGATGKVLKDGVVAWSDIARRSQPNTFLAAGQILNPPTGAAFSQNISEDSTASFDLRSNAAVVDEKTSRIQQIAGGEGQVITLDDGYASPVNVLRWNRAGGASFGDAIGAIPATKGHVNTSEVYRDGLPLRHVWDGVVYAPSPSQISMQGVFPVSSAIQMFIIDTPLIDTQTQGYTLDIQMLAGGVVDTGNNYSWSSMWSDQVSVGANGSAADAAFRITYPGGFRAANFSRLLITVSAQQLNKTLTWLFLGRNAANSAHISVWGTGIHFNGSPHDGIRIVTTAGVLTAGNTYISRSM